MLGRKTDVKNEYDDDDDHDDDDFNNSTIFLKLLAHRILIFL